jgi:hypothetical protein
VQDTGSSQGLLSCGFCPLAAVSAILTVAGFSHADIGNVCSTAALYLPTDVTFLWHCMPV